MHGTELKTWRLAQDWNQTQAARYLGTTQVNVSRWERGTHQIPDSIAYLIYLLRHKRNIRDLENLLLKNP